MAKWTWVLACVLAVPAWAGTTRLPPDGLLVDETTVKPDAAVLAIDAGAVRRDLARGEVARALALLAAIEDPLRHELTAARVVQSLLDAPLPVADAFLARLMTLPPRVFVQHPESAAAWLLPAVDVAAKARAARQVLQRADAAARWGHRLAADPEAAVAALKSASTVDPSGSIAGTPAMTGGQAQANADADARAIADAVRAADGAWIARLEKSRVVLPSPAQAALAQRSRDASVWRAALATAQPVDVLPLFGVVAQRLEPSEARIWLRAAQGHPHYASAAAVAFARLPQAGVARAPLRIYSDVDADRDANVDANAGANPRASASPTLARLPNTDAWRAIDDPDAGAEAALALAAEPEAVERVAQLLHEAAPPPVRLKNLALLLRLVDTDAARALLARLAQDPRLPAAQRAELQR